METPSPGWYPDPFRRYDLRYHNGTSWTADVSAQGERRIDPLGITAAPGGSAPVPRRRNGMGVAAMVLGIVAASTAWMPFVFAVGAICGVLAIVFAIVARRRRVTHGHSQGATVGLVLGPIAIALAVGGFALTRIVLDIVNPGAYEITDESCTEVDGRQVFEAIIHNQSGRERSYTIQVEFLRAGTSRSVLDRTTVDVHDVPAGGSAPFTVSVPARGPALECRVDTVMGAFDFFD